MRAFSILAASLAMVPSIIAQSSNPAQSTPGFNGRYTITSVGDGSVLALDSQSGVFVLRTWYIYSSSRTGDAIIFNARRDSLLTGINGKNEGSPAESQVQVREVADSAEGREKQAWKLIAYDDGTFEIYSHYFDQFLDEKGGVGVGPEVILWSRNQPPSGNQRWRIEEFKFTT